MKATRRRRRTFQPDVDSLEGRVVLSSGAAVQAADADAHAHAVQVQEQRQLKHEVKVELHKHKHTPRNEGQFTGGSLATSSALSITDGTPPQTTGSGSGGSSSGTTSKVGLQIHTLAPNNLDAANLALQGMSDGVETVGSVVSHSRPGPVPKTPTTTTGSTTGTGTGTVTTTPGSSTTSTTPTISIGGGNITITLSTTASSSTASTP